MVRDKRGGGGGGVGGGIVVVVVGVMVSVSVCVGRGCDNVGAWLWCDIGGVYGGEKRKLFVVNAIVWEVVVVVVVAWV